MFSEQLIDGHDASALAYAIVDTVREPFVVLDEDLRVVAASRSFYRTFAVSPGDTQGKFLRAKRWRMEYEVTVATEALGR